MIDAWAESGRNDREGSFFTCMNGYPHDMDYQGWTREATDGIYGLGLVFLVKPILALNIRGYYAQTNVLITALGKATHRNRKQITGVGNTVAGWVCRLVIIATCTPERLVQDLFQCTNKW